MLLRLVAFLLTLSGAIAPCAAVAAPARAPELGTSEWVRVGPDGRLAYKSDANGNRIPNFSNVGYGGGAVSFPDVPVKSTVAPGAGDAGARIQAAIDAVSALPLDATGHRGAVLLKRGQYEIAGTLHVQADGVVLRGEGTGEDGTVLIATGAKQRSLIVVGRGAKRGAHDEDVGADSDKADAAKQPHARVVDRYVPVGARTLHLDRVDGLAVGDAIVVRRPSTENWIHELGMDRIPPAKHLVVQWKPGSKDLTFNRRVVAIAGNEITLDAPIVNALELRYGGAEVWRDTAPALVAEVGIENLRGDSEFKGPTDEKHGWVFIEMAGAIDSWVRGVVSIHYGYSCVNITKSSRAITVDHCACLDPISQITGGRRYSFAVDGQLVLVEHCYARNGRHDFVMHALAAGPNVFFDCVAEEAHADSGPHHRWSVGVLYDNVRVSAPREHRRGEGGLNIRNRGNMGTGHGWAGANQVAWNCRATEMIVEQPPTAQNWAIGCVATEGHTGNAYWDSYGTPVAPQSLYLAQLKERLQSPESTGASVAR